MFCLCAVFLPSPEQPYDGFYETRLGIYFLCHLGLGHTASEYKRMPLMVKNFGVRSWSVTLPNLTELSRISHSGL